MIVPMRVNTCVAKDGPATGHEWQSHGIEVAKVITVDGREYRYRITGDAHEATLEYAFWPPSGFSSPIASFSIVDFPEPLAPMIIFVSRRRTWNDTPFRT